MNEDRIYRNMKTARDDSALKLGCCDWRDPLTQRIGKDIRASSYLFTLGAADINSEACFTAMTGDCDDELAPWTQHDRSRSDTGMINMNFNSYASLVILFIIPVLLYFVFDHETMYTYTWFFLPYVRLKKALKTRTVHFIFWGDFRLCSRYNNINYGAWQVYKPLFGSSVAICGLACSEITLSINEKNLERSPGNGQT